VGFTRVKIELMATGLDLPVNLAFVSESSSETIATLLYVTELYGQVKVITNDWKVYTYANNLLNYEPDYRFPGTCESGVTGLCIEPNSWDLFLSMIYKDNGETKGKVVRTSSKDGLKVESMGIGLIIDYLLHGDV